MPHPIQPRYRVKAGDTLWRIAQQHYGNPGVWPEIARANHIPNANLILVGMNLSLPTIHSASPSGPKTPVHGHLPDPRLLTGPPSLPSAAQAHMYHAAPPPTPARAVMFPAVKYKLDTFPDVTVSTPQADFKVKLTGEITVQQKGVLAELEFSRSGNLSEKLKPEYDSKFAKLAGTVKVKWSPSSPEAEVSYGLTIATKVSGKEFLSHQYEVIPPNKVKYTLKPKDISGEAEGMVFKGNLGYELEITVKGSAPPAQVSAAAPNRTMVWVAVGSLAAAGVAIIVADIIKDVGTFGTGTVESPLSWATAMTLFSRAAAMAH